MMKISVALCTYNGAPYLREQLDSIAVQTRPPDEMIVCDDQSTDSTREIIEAFAISAPFPVRLYINEQNVGSTKNFERVISLCQGDVISLSDQDDVWLPEKLRLIEECLVQNPDAGLVFTDADVVDKDLQPLGYSLWESVGFDNSHRRLVRTGRVLDVLLPGCTVTGATMAFRSVFKALVLEIPTNLALIHDGWIALMIASVADVSFIEQRLIKYRQHGGQQVGAKERKLNKSGPGALGGIKRAMLRTNSFQQMIEICEQAHNRLVEQGGVYKSAGALFRLEARLGHLRTRAQMPEDRLSRVRCVIGELLSRRYHLYSNGFRSAVKDLLA